MLIMGVKNSDISQNAEPFPSTLWKVNDLVMKKVLLPGHRI